MLVVSRKVDEVVTIGESIVIRIVRVSGETVRLGIEAPGQTILRAELVDDGRPAPKKPCIPPETP